MIKSCSSEETGWDENRRPGSRRLLRDRASSAGVIGNARSAAAAAWRRARNRRSAAG